jgi:hypothetical protein
VPSVSSSSAATVLRSSEMTSASRSSGLAIDDERGSSSTNSGEARDSLFGGCLNQTSMNPTASCSTSSCDRDAGCDCANASPCSVIRQKPLRGLLDKPARFSLSWAHSARFLYTG